MDCDSVVASCARSNSAKWQVVEDRTIDCDSVVASYARSNGNMWWGTDGLGLCGGELCSQQWHQVVEDRWTVTESVIMTV